jgi:hypothetical protein
MTVSYGVSSRVPDMKNSKTPKSAYNQFSTVARKSSKFDLGNLTSLTMGGRIDAMTI